MLNILANVSRFYIIYVIWFNQSELNAVKMKYKFRDVVIQALQRKLDDVGSDMRFDETRIKAINTLSDKLVRQGRSDARIVEQRRDILNHRWRSLQGALDDYRRDLAGALEIHSFNRDIDDTEGRINEKISLLNTDDVGKNLPQVVHYFRLRMVNLIHLFKLLPVNSIRIHFILGELHDQVNAVDLLLFNKNSRLESSGFMNHLCSLW